MTTQKVIIVKNGGPGIGEFVDALKYSYSRRHKMRIALTLRRDYEPTSCTWVQEGVQVVGVEYESGSDGMFIITVRIPGVRDKIKGFYNANDRSGFLEFTGQTA